MKKQRQSSSYDINEKLDIETRRKGEEETKKETRRRRRIDIDMEKKR
jgi:hypothetical protein